MDLRLLSDKIRSPYSCQWTWLEGLKGEHFCVSGLLQYFTCTNSFSLHNYLLRLVLFQAPFTDEKRKSREVQ